MNTPVTSRSNTKRRALVLIPGELNYFYNLCGRRLAETLRELSFEVDIGTLADYPAKTYDWCVLSNVSEVVFAFGHKEAALAKLRGLKPFCKVMTTTSIDSVATPWYRAIREYCQALDIHIILDFSLHDQSELLAPEARSTYHYLPAGLTTAERRGLDETNNLDNDRAIPWAFVGHVTPDRVALVDYLIQNVDPRGFVYLPRVASYTEKGSPHLNQQQFDAVLRQTRYQIWCSHHYAFYMESERFRMSLLAGGVPIKVLIDPLHSQHASPFSYLMFQERELAERLRALDFVAVREQFQRDFRNVKPLRIGLAEFLVAMSVIDHDEVASLTEDRQRFAQAA